MKNSFALTDEQIARLHALRADGIPATWIAEDIQCSVDAVKKRAPGDPAEHREWLSVFGQIRRNAALFALHREFAPRGS